MTERSQSLRFISDQLGGRDLFWGGLRSDDVEAISDLPNLAGSFSIIGGRGRGGAVPSLDFEDLSRERVDLDTWDLSDHLNEEPALQFREGILHLLSGPSALLPYRSTSFLSSIAFARQDRCLELGLFGEHQAMFEHKPWVESQVARLGIPRVPWTYVADEERFRVEHLLRAGPIMLRSSRSSGGVGFTRVEDRMDLAAGWPTQSDGFASVAPALDDALPINVGATVWRDGVTVSHPSVQLVGIPECTSRPYGYCGNDFGAAREIELPALAQIQESTRRIGDWMRCFGYLGAFGVDFLLHDGRPLFTEVNARFQGSTFASSLISSQQGESCVLLDHLAAFLGAPAPMRPGLTETVPSLPQLGHIVVHRLEGPPSPLDASSLVESMHKLRAVRSIDVVAKPDVIAHAGAVVLRALVESPLTTTGFDLEESIRLTILRDHQREHLR